MSRFGIPLMEIFFPLVAGVLWAKFCSMALLGIIFLGALYLRLYEGKKVLGHSFLIIFAAIYAFLRFEGEPAIKEAQIRHLTYDIRLEKVDFKGERSKVYGYGRIEKVYGERYKLLEGHTLYFYLNGDRAYIPSQVVRMRSGVRVLRPDTSETFFSYLVQKNIHLYGYRGEVLGIEEEENIFWHFFAVVNRVLRDRISGCIERYGREPSDGILYGILLSEKKELSKEQKAKFHHTSAAHLLAVSGLHIAMIGVTLDLLLRCFFLKKFWRRWPIMGILLFYVGAIGFPPSAVRAWVMLSCYWCAGFFSRRASGLSSLLLAAILTLFYNPILLFDIGFQLSYGVVALLLLLAAPLRDGLLWLFRRVGFYDRGRRGMELSWMDRLRWKVAELLSISVAATLASAPLTFEYFNMFSLAGIFLNPVIIQMALPVVACGFLFLLLGLLHRELFLGDLLFLWARRWATWIDGLLSAAEQYMPWHVEFLTKPGGVGIIFFMICAAISLKIYEIHRNFQGRRIRRIVL
ncbi:MAG: ComEC/Rec2 family competence protein [Puniceicoccales bacterium]|nr:ComEC/Rec2 family competence protein [Puniceicoccales bacterium]